MEELTIGDKIYISSKRAAEITGYAKDYIGQLCREGRVEATLVGRSWYVLESSLRAHRFGAAAEQKGADEVSSAAPTEAFSTWETPNYAAEESQDIPSLEKRSVNVLETAPNPPAQAEVKPASIEDMQSAWKEWFASRSEEKGSSVVAEAEEAPEEVVLEPEESTYEEKDEQTEVTQTEEELHLVNDPVPTTPEIEEPVQIHRTREAYIAPVAPAPSYERPRSRNRRRRTTGSSYLAVRALLISVAILAVATAAIGAGLADNFSTKNGIEYAPLRILGGTSLLVK